MDHPGRLLALFKTVHASRLDPTDPDFEPCITGHPAVDNVIATLGPSDLARLLRHVRDWNATARTSSIAQSILHAVLKLRPAEDLTRAVDGNTRADELTEEKEEESDDALAVSSRRNGKDKEEGDMKDLVDRLIPYTERHFARIDRMVQDSYIVDYILGEMDLGLYEGLDGDVDHVMEVEA